MSTYTVSVLINGNASGYRRATQDGERSTRSFVAFAQREYTKLRQFVASTQGQLAGLGASVGFVQMQRNAAQLEKTLAQVRLSMGMSVREQTEAYESMFAMVKRNGGVMEEAVAGFASLGAAGLKYQAAMKATEAINMARTVTGANETVLASALNVAAANFGFDLERDGVALEKLDKMTVAGRSGNAELEDLARLFPQIAQGAKSAGMSFEKTLAYMEAMSKFTVPERLGTLAESTLRVFTNASYSRDAQKATGVRFFDGAGGRRDPVEVMEDLRKKYKTMTTDQQRFGFITKAFGKADLDTQRGQMMFMSGSMLEDWRDIETAVYAAGGVLKKDLPDAVNNAVVQASRLKNTLRLAAEAYAKPLNDAFTRGTKFLLDSKQQGGLGLSGGQLAGGAAAGAVGLYAASRFLPPLLRGIAGRFGGVGAGVATGKALEAAAGVTPVYVTNWSEMGGSSGVGMVGTGAAAAGGAAAVGLMAKLRGIAATAAILGTSPLALAGARSVAGGVGLAGAAGYAVGSGIYHYGMAGNAAGNGVGELVARFLGMLGNEEAQRSVAINDAFKSAKVGGEVVVRVMADPSLSVQSNVKANNGTRMTADVGQTNQGVGW